MTKIAQAWEFSCAYLPAYILSHLIQAQWSAEVGKSHEAESATGASFPVSRTHARMIIARSSASSRKLSHDHREGARASAACTLQKDPETTWHLGVSSGSFPRYSIWYNFWQVFTSFKSYLFCYLPCYVYVRRAIFRVISKVISSNLLWAEVIFWVIFKVISSKR